jgi:hypothetical protein
MKVLKTINSNFPSHQASKIFTVDPGNDSYGDDDFIKLILVVLHLPLKGKVSILKHIDQPKHHGEFGVHVDYS